MIMNICFKLFLVRAFSALWGIAQQGSRRRQRSSLGINKKRLCVAFGTR